MQLNLKPLMTGMRSHPKELPFDCALDLSGVICFGQKPFPQPVHIKGIVRSRSGVLTLDYTADFLMETACARCLSPIQREDVREFTHTVVESVSDEQSEDVFVLAPGGYLDVTELVSGDLLLQMEGVTLCQDDCKGLCPQCGIDRNISDCGCSQ